MRAISAPKGRFFADFEPLESLPEPLAAHPGSGNDSTNSTRQNAELLLAFQFIGQCAGGVGLNGWIARQRR
jgi:hypothetical protein